jgi:hypothetical protein
MVGSKMRSERLFDLILLHIFQPVHSYHKIDVTYFSLFTASVAAHEQHSTLSMAIVMAPLMAEAVSAGGQACGSVALCVQRCMTLCG